MKKILWGTLILMAATLPLLGQGNITTGPSQRARSPALARNAPRTPRGRLAQTKIRTFTHRGGALGPSLSLLPSDS
jgi:hypothetical protein